MLDLKKKIREVPNWPKEGVNFKDITTLLQDKEAFKQVVDLICEPLLSKKIDKVVGIDARGFLLAAPAAYKLGSGLAIVRKLGKLPFNIIEKEYTLEYGTNTIQMHEDAIMPGEKVVLIDDLIATGGTAVATCDLIEKLGGKIEEVCFLIDLPLLGGANILKKRFPVRSLVSYDDKEEL